MTPHALLLVRAHYEQMKENVSKCKIEHDMAERAVTIGREKLARASKEEKSYLEMFLKERIRLCKLASQEYSCAEVAFRAACEALDEAERGAPPWNGAY